MRIVKDFRGRKVVEVGSGRTRVFTRPWPHWLPFAWRAYGMTAFGVGPIGVNVFARRPEPDKETP